MLFYGTFLLGN